MSGRKAGERNYLTSMTRGPVKSLDDAGNLIQHSVNSREEAHGIVCGLENGGTVRKTNLEDVFIKLTGERIE